MYIIPGLSVRFFSRRRGLTERWLTIMVGFLLFVPGMPQGTHAAEECEEARVMSVHCGAAPSAVFDTNGVLWVVFEQEGHAWLSRSEDLGDTYDDPVQVNTVPERIETNGENRPKIVLDENRGHLYVSWTQQTEGQFTGDIRFSRSLDGGESFEPPRTINDDGLLTSHRFESMMLTDSGALYLAWLDKRNLKAARENGEDYRGSAVYFTISRDGGETFEPNRRIADHSCECCRIALAPHGKDGLTLMWRHVFDGSQRDHAMATLVDGRVDSEMRRVTRDQWAIEACPHHGPDIDVAASDQSLYHLTWFTNSDLRQGILYGRHDLDSGWISEARLVDGTAGASHPQIMVHNATVTLAWKRFDGERTTVQVQSSVDGGESWTDPQAVADTEDASDHPLLLMHPEGDIFLAWWTRADGYRVQAIASMEKNDASGPEPESLAPDQRNTDFEANIHPFDAGTFDSILQEYEGRPFVLALWSVTCPPCMVELEMLGRLLESYPDLPLVLVSTDAMDRRADAEDFLLDYGLSDIRSWMFADAYTERLRHTIDPRWYGELPRSYHFDPAHRREAHSGILTQEQITEWLDL